MATTHDWHPTFTIAPGQTIPLKLKGWKVIGGQAAITSYSRLHAPNGVHIFLDVERVEGEQVFSYCLRAVVEEGEIAALFSNEGVHVLRTDEAVRGSAEYEIVITLEQTMTPVVSAIS